MNASNENTTPKGEDKRKLDRSVDETRNAEPAEPRTFDQSTPEGLPMDDAGRLTATDGSPLHVKPSDEPLKPEEKPDQLAKKAEEAEDRQEALIDEGVEETFPASDPVSVKRIT